MSNLPERYRTMVGELRANFDTGFTRSYEWRREQVQAFQTMCKKHYKDIVKALADDLHKPETEADISEVATVEYEAINVLKNLKAWTAPEDVPTAGLCIPAHSEVRREPYGVVLIIAPFNYPFQLAVTPVLNALAAGNVVVLKPSELTSATSALMAKLLPAYVDRRAIRIVEGSVPETTALLEQKWDLIFFTGSGTVGKLVHQAAAKSLTPCILELGGKSPVVVDKSVRDIELAAKRIMWGKLMNAGQTCIAPDYMLCHQDVYPRVVAALIKEVNNMYKGDPKGSPDYCRIVSEAHTARMQKLLAEKPGKVEIGGDVDVKDRYVAPTIITNVSMDAKIMAEEIFGPILPILQVANMEEATRIINKCPNPLALYVFANSETVCEQVMRAVPSGTVCLNDTVVQFSSHTLPFGGIHTSGLGKYHGKYAFHAFTHARAVLRRWDHWLGDVPLRYPPYSPTTHRMFRALCDSVQAQAHWTKLRLGRLFSLSTALMALGLWQLIDLVLEANGKPDLRSRLGF